MAGNATEWSFGQSVPTHPTADGTGEHLYMRFADRGAEIRLPLNPELAFGALFTEGRIIVTGGTIYDLILLFMCRKIRTDA